MIKTRCFGIIPLRFSENDWEVFLVQHLNGGHWGFPKGHAEKGENPKQTAERELREETSMEVIRYLPQPYLTENYRYESTEGCLIDKTVRFYLAEVTSKYAIQSSEIIRGHWIPLKELLSYAIFPEEQGLYTALIRSLS